MKYSYYGEDMFTYTSNAVLPLPLTYPRTHVAGDGRYPSTYLRRAQMAHIRADEIIEFIVPWLAELETFDEGMDGALPQIGIPENLLQKIHLYNCMLQLGIASYFQKRLIDALVRQMHKSDLQHCHLDTLEMTIGRFYSRGIAVLDPVINYLVGEFAFRTSSDRYNTVPPEEMKVLDSAEYMERRQGRVIYLPTGAEREWLEYSSANPGRSYFPDDTIIVPPKLEVLGHAIRHWSGVRRSGNRRTAPAFTGYPLNVGRVLKVYAPQGETSKRKGLKCEHAYTYRLRKIRKRPGERFWAAASAPMQPAIAEASGKNNTEDDTTNE